MMATGVHRGRASVHLDPFFLTAWAMRPRHGAPTFARLSSAGTCAIGAALTASNLARYAQLTGANALGGRVGSIGMKTARRRLFADWPTGCVCLLGRGNS